MVTCSGTAGAADAPPAAIFIDRALSAIAVPRGSQASSGPDSPTQVGPPRQ